MPAAGSPGHPWSPWRQRHCGCVSWSASIARAASLLAGADAPHRGEPRARALEVRVLRLAGARPASRKWLVCASKPSRRARCARTPAGESSKVAPPPRASTTVTALEAENGARAADRRRRRPSRRSPAAAQQRGARACRARPRRRGCGSRMLRPTARPRRGDAELRQIPASVIVEEALAVDRRRRPDHAALGRVGVPVPVLGQPRARPALRSRGRPLHSGATASSVRAFIIATISGARPAPAAKALHLGREPGVPARDERQHAVAEAQQVVALEADRDAEEAARRRARRPRPRARRAAPGAASARGRVELVGAELAQRARVDCHLS